MKLLIILFAFAFLGGAAKACDIKLEDGVYYIERLAYLDGESYSEAKSPAELSEQLDNITLMQGYPTMGMEKISNDHLTPASVIEELNLFRERKACKEAKKSYAYLHKNCRIKKQKDGSYIVERYQMSYGMGNVMPNSQEILWRETVADGEQPSAINAIDMRDFFIKADLCINEKDEQQVEQRAEQLAKLYLAPFGNPFGNSQGSLNFDPNHFYGHYSGNKVDSSERETETGWSKFWDEVDRTGESIFFDAYGLEAEKISLDDYDSLQRRENKGNQK
jgi:hypothetical protein